MTPAPGSPSCHLCRGRHRIEEEVATENVFTHDLAEFMASFGPYHQHGIMPLGPDRQDQPATWLEAATFLEAALNDYRAAERKDAEEKRQQDRKRPQAPR